MASVTFTGTILDSRQVTNGYRSRVVEEVKTHTGKTFKRYWTCMSPDEPPADGVTATVRGEPAFELAKDADGRMKLNRDDEPYVNWVAWRCSYGAEPWEPPITNERIDEEAPF